MDLYTIIGIVVFVNFLMIMGASVMALISNKRRLARELAQREERETE